MMYQHIKRNFGPVYNSNSKILILGSFPSIKSRDTSFYYGHSQNRFWPLLERILGCKMPLNIKERKSLLLEKGIALWDVVEECDIIGSSDSSIKNVIPVDIMQILNSTVIQNIYCNGNTSFRLFMLYLYPICHRTPIKLPSTSPANAAWLFEELVKAWEEII